jgi:hypothetical protein
MRAQAKAIVGAFVAICLAIDLFPHSGPPEFRYNGSDPTATVWNLGWPLALAIYDPQSGLHMGPLVYLVLPVQMLILIVATILVAAVSRAVDSARFSWGGRLHPRRNS